MSIASQYFIVTSQRARILVPAPLTLRERETTAAQKHDCERGETIEKLELRTEAAALWGDHESFALNDENERHEEVEHDHQRRGTREDPENQQDRSDDFSHVHAV